MKMKVFPVLQWCKLVSHRASFSSYSYRTVALQNQFRVRKNQRYKWLGNPSLWPTDKCNYFSYVTLFHFIILFIYNLFITAVVTVRGLCQPCQIRWVQMRSSTSSQGTCRWGQAHSWPRQFIYLLNIYIYYLCQYTKLSCITYVL